MFSEDNVTCKCRTSASGIFFKWGMVRSCDGVCPKYAIWSCVARCCTCFGKTKEKENFNQQIQKNQTDAKGNWTYWVWYLININCPFIGNVEENIICQYSFFTTLLIPGYSKLLMYITDSQSWYIQTNSRVRHQLKKI